jgi:hypothetical protein
MCPFPGSFGEWLFMGRFSAKTVLIPFHVWKKAEACGRLYKRLPVEEWDYEN